MLETAHQLIRQVGGQLGLNQADIDYLLKTDAEHEFEKHEVNFEMSCVSSLLYY